MGWNGKNLFSGFTKGKWVSGTDGIEIIKDNAAVTDFIEVDFDNNQYYMCSGLEKNLWCFVAAYNENKEFINRTTGSSRSSILLYNELFNAEQSNIEKIKYIRITQYEVPGYTTGKIDDIDNIHIQLETGDSATSYEPYILTIDTLITQEKPHTLTAIWSKQ